MSFIRTIIAVLLLVAVIVPATVTAQTTKDPVIFVHGWVAGYGLTPWGTIKNNLIRDGWSANRLYEIYYSDPIWASNVENARELAAFVDRVLRETGATKVDLVCHSMGGLSARYYIKFLGGVNKVDDYVALGTPQHGTIYASLGAILTIGSAGATEMTPGSLFLLRLNAGDETPGAVSYFSFGSYTDELVQPWRTIALDGATNRWVSGVSHTGLLSNPTIYQWVKAALS